jgi:hypothetical protein
VVSRSSSTPSATFVYNYAANFPDSKDYSNSYYGYFMAMTVGDYSYYYCTYTTTVNQGYLSYATPTYGVTVPVFGNTLQTYSSPFVFSVDLTGFKLYSNQRTVGPFIGSFIQVVASGFTAISGCGVYLYNNNQRPFYNSGLYCVTVGSNTLKIYSNADIAFSGILVVTLSTTSIPSSTTFTLSLYDKYITGSDYGISVQVSQTISNAPGGYSFLPTTNILWRRQAYKQLSNTAGPFRITINNNFQYVSSYSMSTNS